MPAAAADEPIPIRRVAIDPARIPAEVREQQELIAVPRQEFEDLVRRASQGQESGAPGPRILESRYRAAWQEGQLVGTADWRTFQSRNALAVLPLDPWNLALRGRPMVDGRPGVAGDFESQGLGILLESSGVHAITLNWSARPERQPEGDWFHLQLPAAPVAVLELDLPADRSLDVPAARQSTATVELHTDGIPGGMRRWQIAFGNQSRSELDLLVRPVSAPGAPTLFVARPSADFQITLAGGEAIFQWDLEVVRGKLSELHVDWDDAYQPLDVQIRPAGSQAPTWKLAAAKGRRWLSIALTEAIEKRAILEIHCRLGSLPMNGRRVFAVPGLREAQLGRTLMRIRTSPDVGLTDWQFAHFRPDAPPQQVKENNLTWESLALAQIGFNGAAGPLFPSAVVQAPASDVAVQQDSWWQINLERSTLTTGLNWQVRSGRLSTLLVQLPVGWEIEDLDLSAPDQVRDWYRDKKRAGEPLVVELKNSLDAGKSLRLTLTLQSSLRALAMGQKAVIPVPWVLPIGVRWQEGNMAIALERGGGRKGPLPFKASMPEMTAREGPGPFRLSPFLPMLAADFHYSYHGRPTPANLELEPISPRLQIQASTEVVAAAKQSSAAYSLYLEPLAGSPQVFALNFSPLRPVRWEVIAGANTLIGQPHRLSQGPDGKSEVWEFRFRQPLQDKVTIRGYTEFETEASTDVPLPRPASASDGFEGAVLIRTAKGHDVEVASTGLQPAEPDPSAITQSQPPIWRAYRYGKGETALALHVGPSAAPLPAGRVVESIEFISETDGEGTVVSHYRFVLRNPQRRRLLLHLPETALLQTVAVNGSALPDPDIEGDGVLLPEGGTTATYEVTYAERQAALALFSHLPSGSPWWDSDVVVLQQNRFWRLPQTLTPIAFATSCQPTPPAPSTNSLLPDWTLYEVADAGAPLYCIRRDLPHLCGLLMAVTAAFVGAGMRRIANGRGWFLGLGLWVGVMALIWLPDGLRPLAWWPLAVVAVVGWRWRQVPARRSSNSSAVAARVTVVLLCLWQLCLPRSAADEASTTVYLLPPPANHPEQQTVLVPRLLWARLNALANDKSFEAPTYVLLQADYSGKTAGTSMEMDAEFRVQIMRDGMVPVKLPVGNVRLKQVLLDSAPVLAVPSRQPDGFSVAVDGKDEHVIKLTWEMQPRQRGDELELQWSAPPTAASRLTLNLAGPAIPVRVVGQRGGRWLTHGPAATQLEADLGRLSEVIVRWPASRQPGKVLVRDAYLLDLQPQEAHLRAVLRYEISSGAVSQLHMRLPLGLEVKSVDVKGEPSQDAAPRLQDWSLSDTRDLTLELSHPISGKMRVHLDLLVQPAILTIAADLDRAAPVVGGWRAGVLHMFFSVDPQALAASRTFKVPWILHHNAKHAEGYWAYRADNLLVTPLRTERPPSPIDRESFTRLWPTELGGLAGVVGFAPLPAGGAATHLTVQPLAPRMQVAQHLALGPGSGEADLRAQLDVSVMDGPLSLLEWQVPAEATVGEVQGADLLRWNRQANTLQLWLKRSIVPAAGGELGKTSISLSGWLPQTRDKGEGERLVIPRLRVLNAQVQSTHIEVLRRRPMTVHEENFVHLRRENGTAATEPVVRTYLATQSDYSGLLRIVFEKPTVPGSTSGPAPATTPKEGAVGRAVPGVQVLLADYESKLDFGQRGIHRATYVLLYDAGTTWTTTVPEGATLVEVLVNGQAAAGVQYAAGQVHVPLPARGGWCEVTIRWAELDLSSTEGMWTFRPPQGETDSHCPATWTVRLPAILYSSAEHGHLEQNAYAWQDLNRAEALGKLTQQLAERWKADTDAWQEWQMAKLQERFQGLLRDADRRLRLAGKKADEMAQARLAALRKENQRALRNTVWENLRSKTEDLVKDLPDLAVDNSDVATVTLAYSFSEVPSQAGIQLSATPAAQHQLRLLASLVVSILAAAGLMVRRRRRGQ